MKLLFGILITVTSGIALLYYRRANILKKKLEYKLLRHKIFNVDYDLYLIKRRMNSITQDNIKNGKYVSGDTHEEIRLSDEYNKLINDRGKYYTEYITLRPRYIKIKDDVPTGLKPEVLMRTIHECVDDIDLIQTQIKNSEEIFQVMLFLAVVALSTSFILL